MSDSGPLDPTHYVEHVTRTALLLEQLARDVKTLREHSDYSSKQSSDLRKTVSAMELDIAVYRVDMAAKVSTNKETIEALQERIKWLSRLVLGAVITAIIGGLVALSIRSIGSG